MTADFRPMLHLVDDWETAERFMRWLTTTTATSLGCDTETGGLDWWREPLRVVQFGDLHDGWAIPYEGWGGLVQEALDKWRGPLIFQNAKFDLHFLETAGHDVGRHRVHDTKIIAHLTDNVRSNSLKSLACTLVDPAANSLQEELNLGFHNNGWNWRSVPVDYPAYWQYAALDPVLTAWIWERHEQERKDYGALYDMEITVQQQLIDMERKGLPVDVPYVEQAITGLESEVEELQERLRDYGVERPGSNDHVSGMLIAAGVPLTARTDKGNLKLDEEVLKSVDHPIAELVLKYRHAKKISRTYLQNFLDLEDGGRIHASVNQLGARTGRMSVGRPSLQNLERSALVRNAFAARPGHKLVLIDYDQIEYRLMAHYAGLDRIRQAAINGDDLHTTTARAIYGLGPDDDLPKEQRQLTKNATFAKLYGAGLEKFAQTARVPMTEAETFMSLYDAANPEVVQFMERVTRTAQARAQEDGFAHITTAYGRRLRRESHRGDYVFVNYLIQGTAADVLKEKMMRLGLEGLDQYMLLPVHDELVFEVPEEEIADYIPEVVACMEDRDRFSVPLTVDVDIVDRWGESYD